MRPIGVKWTQSYVTGILKRGNSNRGRLEECDHKLKNTED